MKIEKIDATDLQDLWFQAIYNIIDKGERYKIDQGSYKGQTRIEFDYFIGHVKNPGTRPLLPKMPEGSNVPDPCSEEYLYGSSGNRSYIEYLMTSEKQPNESYTYGSRLTNSQRLTDYDFLHYNGKTQYFNQIEIIIDRYKNKGYKNNQLVLQVAKPQDLFLDDPPCLRHIDTKIKDNKLHFIVCFRSWDLWSGMPANLAAIQILKEYMASEIGVDDGEMIVESKGLHIYGYVEELAKIRCGKC